jgi:hypothetical protein
MFSIPDHGFIGVKTGFDFGYFFGLHNRNDKMLIGEYNSNLNNVQGNIIQYMHQIQKMASYPMLDTLITFKL